jgi:hypothetical protein
VAVPSVHAPCRTNFKRMFHLKDTDMLPELHCCWDLPTILEALGIRVGRLKLGWRPLGWCGVPHPTTGVCACSSPLSVGRNGLRPQRLMRVWLL